MIKAPITPGTQPQIVRRTTIKKDPQPLSITAKGGRKMHNIARKSPMMTCGYLQLHVILE